jgi:hypothetical protein
MVSTWNVTPIFIHSIFLSTIADRNNVSKATGNYAVLTYCKHFAELDDAEWEKQEEPTMLNQFPTDLLLWGKLVIFFLRFVNVPTQLPTDRAIQALSSDAKWTGREANDSHL